MRFCPWAFLCLLLVTVGLSAETVWLDDLNLKPIVQGYGRPMKNRHAAKNPEEAKPLKIHGKVFERGVGTVAESVFVVHLDGAAKTFSAQVGLDDAKRGSARSSVEFFVIGDGRMLWRSGVMRTGTEAKPFEVNVAGVKQLLLKVGDAEDGDNEPRHDEGVVTP